MFSLKKVLRKCVFSFFKGCQNFFSLEDVSKYFRSDPQWNPESATVRRLSQCRVMRINICQFVRVLISHYVSINNIRAIFCILIDSLTFVLLSLFTYRDYVIVWRNTCESSSSSLSFFSSFSFDRQQLPKGQSYLRLRADI